jgi:hypothetical protein
MERFVEDAEQQQTKEQREQNDGSDENEGKQDMGKQDVKEM